MNDGLLQYLDGYITSKNSPGFAVMLNGKWGSGKTHFIKNQIEKRHSSKFRFFYVSLYGISSIDQINSEFFRLMHPLLGSKTARVTGKILSTALKASLRFDYDGDGKSDGSLSVSLPQGELEKLNQISEESILVFDDLERSSIPTNEVLGYINSFVEHENMKVIISSNEEEIINNKDNNDYLRIREKLIGRTFRISSNFEEAITFFIEKIEDKDSRKFVNSKKELIAQIFKLSEIENLRLIKTALFDFEQIYKNFSPTILKSEELLDHFFAAFLILHMADKSGNLGKNDAFQINYSASNDEKKTAFQKELSKYDELVLTIGLRGVHLESNFLIEKQTWIQLIWGDSIDLKELILQLENCYYIKQLEKGDWYRLWHFHYLETEEFDELLSSVKESFTKMEFSRKEEVFHVMGIFLRLIEKNCLEYTVEEVFEQSKRCIDNLFENEKIPLNKSRFEDDSPGSFRSHDGLGYTCSDHEMFTALFDYLAARRKEKQEELRMTPSALLIDGLKSGSSKISEHLYHSHRDEFEYWGDKVFTEIEPGAFVEILKGSSRDSLNSLSYALKKRYGYSNSFEFVGSELDFLKQLLMEVEAWMNSVTHPFTKWGIEDFRDNIRRCISNLEESREKTTD